MQIAARSQHHRYRHHTVLEQRQKIRAARLALLEEHDLADGGVVQVPHAVKASAEVGIRNRLDIEDERIHRGPSVLIRMATATTRPASSVNVR